MASLNGGIYTPPVLPSGFKGRADLGVGSLLLSALGEAETCGISGALSGTLSGGGPSSSDDELPEREAVEELPPLAFEAVEAVEAVLLERDLGISPSIMWCNALVN
jgi:hypothetical protein